MQGSKNLKKVLSLTGSQYKDDSNGVMRARLLAPVKSLATEL